MEIEFEAEGFVEDFHYHAYLQTCLYNIYLHLRYFDSLICFSTKTSSPSLGSNTKTEDGAAFGRDALKNDPRSGRVCFKSNNVSVKRYKWSNLMLDVVQ